MFDVKAWKAELRRAMWSLPPNLGPVTRMEARIPHPVTPQTAAEAAPSARGTMAWLMQVMIKTCKQGGFGRRRMK